MDCGCIGKDGAGPRLVDSGREGRKAAFDDFEGGGTAKERRADAW